MEDLIKSVSIEALLASRQAQIKRARIMIETVAEATSAYGLGLPRIEFQWHCGRSYTLDIAHLPDLVKEIDAGGWAYLMNESGLRTLMDCQARRDWDTKIINNDVPELTYDNIVATFAALHESRSDLFDRGVLNLFRRLSWDYKTNSPMRFGPRIIMNYMADCRFGITFFRSSSVDELDDLMRVCHLLDGRPEPDHRDSIGVALNNSSRAESRCYENDYLQIKWFKKGSAHVRFKRLDVVDRLNEILIKHYPDALPART